MYPGVIVPRIIDSGVIDPRIVDHGVIDPRIMDPGVIGSIIMVPGGNDPRIMDSESRCIKYTLLVAPLDSFG